jgi:hypothetical protein
VNPLDRYELAAPPPGIDGDCWLWTGTLNSSGYGTVTMEGRRQMAHRWVYEAARGDIPAGCALDHRCRRPRCVNPFHLEAVTQSENERRKPTRERLQRGEVCPRGHPLVGVNKVSGGECRLCTTTTKRSGP